MNRLFLLLFTTSIVLVGNAQIVIDQNDFPSGGDTAVVSLSDDVDVDFEATGEDYSWYFEGLTRIGQRIDTFYDVSSAAATYQFVFNNSLFEPDYQAEYYESFTQFVIPSTEALGITFSNPVSFTRVESDAVEKVGIGVEVNGFAVPVKSEIIDVAYELPLTFSDEWVSNSFLELDLNPAFDGIFKRYQTRTSIVDGYGEITTPYGTFDAIRVKAELEYTDSLRITIADTPTWLELPTPNQIYYTWFAKDEWIPVLEVVAQVSLLGETISSITYKDDFYGTVGIEENTENNFTIYPNPATNRLTINTIENYELIEIYALDGTLVWQEKGSFIAQKTIDVSHLSKGIYHFQLKNTKGVHVQRVVIR